MPIIKEIKSTLLKHQVYILDWQTTSGSTQCVQSSEFKSPLPLTSYQPSLLPHQKSGHSMNSTRHMSDKLMTSRPQPRAGNMVLLPSQDKHRRDHFTCLSCSAPNLPPLQAPKTVPCFTNTCGLEIILNNVSLDKKLSQSRVKPGRSLESHQQILMTQNHRPRRLRATAALPPPPIAGHPCVRCR